MQMLEVMREHNKRKKKPGRPIKLSLEDQLLMALEYWREYRTYFHIGQSWGVDESTAYRIVRKIEDILIKSKVFSLPGKKKLTHSDRQIEVVVVDVTETPIERPKKNIHRFYSGKKKKHTLKSQVVVEQESREIICTAHGKGKEHDFRLYKNSKLRLNQDTELLGDKGYQGVDKLYQKSRTPKKKLRKQELSPEDNM